MTAPLARTDSPNINSIYKHISGAIMRVTETKDGFVHFDCLEGTDYKGQPKGEMSIEEFNRTCTYVRKAA